MLSIRPFFKYSIYIGHSALNSIILSSWFFYKLKKKIWIINLFKTIIFIKLVFKFLKYLTLYNLPFWFINLDLSREFLFRKNALECGEFACTKVWIRGFLSNFKSIQNAIGKYILKKHILKINKKKYLINIWYFTRFTWPRGIFLSDIPSNYVICKEAATILLPVVALVDTDVRSYLFNYPIPSNDDSIVSINYILSLISKKLLLYKYKKVIIWYNKYKARKNKIFNRIFLLNKKVRKFIKLKSLKLRKLKKKIKKGFFIKKYKKDYLNCFNNCFNIRRYFNLKLLYSNNLPKIIFLNIFNKLQYFKKNTNRLIKSNNILKPKFINRTSKTMLRVYKLNKKLKFLKKINIIKNHNKNLLWLNRLKLKQQPLYLYKKTINLKYSQKTKKQTYLYYYLISNFLRKSKVFHETFFINKPNNFTYIRSFHKFNLFYYNNKYKYDNSKFYSKRDYWYGWGGYKFKINYFAKKKFLRKKFNLMLLKNWKYNKKLSLSDSAILFNLERWVTYNKKASLMRSSGRFLLTYWLYPYFRRFSIKDKFRWYSSKFFYKEDVNFNQHFNWNVNKFKTPLTTFHFYNNWFSFFFKYNYLKKKKNKKTFDRKLQYLRSIGLDFVHNFKKKKKKNV